VPDESKLLTVLLVPLPQGFLRESVETLVANKGLAGGRAFESVKLTFSFGRLPGALSLFSLLLLGSPVEVAAVTVVAVAAVGVVLLVAEVWGEVTFQPLWVPVTSVSI